MSSTLERMCFVLMPFNSKFKNQWELAFRPAIEGAGLTPFRGDEDKLGTNVIIRDVTRCIFEAQLIVADLTGRNPNVMYELGLAHAAKKPVIMLAQEEQDVPFDVRHVRYLKYDERDLTSLRRELQDRIVHTVRMDASQQPDYFPELIPMRADEARELRYLRARTPDLMILTYPPTADIFFNDKLLGQSPQVVKINPDAAANWLSVSSVEYFEYHGEIDRKTALSGSLGIVLEVRDKALFARRVPGYLRERRKYPNNPVLMRAVAYYLWTSGEFDEALAESRELLSVAPHWAHAHNQAGFIQPQNSQGYADQIRHFESTAALQPHSHVGWFNLACTYSLMGRGEDCLRNLHRIIDDPVALRSYCFTPRSSIIDENNFDPLRADPQLASRFRELEAKLTRQWTEFESQRRDALMQVESAQSR